MTGIILLNKPKGISSNTAVNIVKKAVGASKAGHLGTLDVAAQGLLPVAINSSTKLFDLFLNKPKQYQTTIKFGEQTDTYDLEGEITLKQDVNITQVDVEKVLPKFVGEIMQMPPQFSAKKINGKKAYQLAREGKSVALQPKCVNIFSLKLLSHDQKNMFTFQVDCSSGTYIRALCRDLAAALSTCGVCYDITRTRCGDFDLKNASTLEEIKSGNYNLIAPEKLFNFQTIKLSNLDCQKLLNGQFLKTNLPDGQYKLFSNEFLGLGEVKGGLLKLSLKLN